MVIAGGATSGYCDTGMVDNDSKPKSAILRATTQAKIGRSIKKCGIRQTHSLQKTDAIKRLFVFGLGFGSRCLMIGFGNRLVILPRQFLYRCTWADFLPACDNLRRIWFETFLYNDHASYLLPYFNGSYLGLALVVNNTDRGGTACAILNGLSRYC